MLATYFASPGRSENRDLERHIGYFSDGDFIRALLNAMPSILLILNSHRQVVFANHALYTLLNLAKDYPVLGLRPGEIMACRNVADAPSGCGTSKACAECGAVLSILEGLEGRKAVKECRLTRLLEGELEDMDLLVWSTPFHYNGDDFTICAFTDISQEKRRNALEKIFFHDILNVAGGIKGFADLLTNQTLDDSSEIVDMISTGADKIIDEIRSQQLLVAAEAGDLKLTRSPIRISDLLEEIVSLYRSHEAGMGRQIDLQPVSADEIIVSDPVLLGRVIGNMLKNALEATPRGKTVTIGCAFPPENVEFWVHNPGMIPLGAQFQIFHRSFSTKGLNRGLGTYSMRMLSSYLCGEVRFSSTEADGTVFRARYPRQVH